MSLGFSLEPEVTAHPPLTLSTCNIFISDLLTLKYSLQSTSYSTTPPTFAITVSKARSNERERREILSTWEQGQVASYHLSYRKASYSTANLFVQLKKEQDCIWHLFSPLPQGFNPSI